jgi:hypothetical protein
VADERLQVELERSGGFAGVTLHASVDTATLPPAEADTVRRLVDQADLDALARRPPTPSRAPDRFQYDLTVTRGGRRQHLSLGETAVTPELRPLLDHLLQRARG